VVAGGVVYLAQYGNQASDTRQFHREPPELCSVPGIIADALSLDSRGIIQLGLLLLVATPVARVVFALAGFALQRDLTYFVITLLVLTILLYSLIVGRV